MIINIEIIIIRMSMVKQIKVFLIIKKKMQFNSNYYVPYVY